MVVGLVAGSEASEVKVGIGGNPCRHGTVHLWTTDQRQPNREDMGNFYSAARNPIFFAHHGNIDRLWHVWRGLRPSNTDFADPDWLDAAFLFYDEEARLVRVRVRDCLGTAALRYTYQDVGLPWLNARPAKASFAVTLTPATGSLPATLDKTIRVTVTRPRVSRSRREKEEEEEVLVVEGIEIADHFNKFVKFDVLVNEPEGGVDGTPETATGYCAGSVAHTPHMIWPKETRKGSIKTVARFGVCDLMDDIGADGDRTVVVSLVPRSGGELITVGGLSISYLK